MKVIEFSSNSNRGGICKYRNLTVKTTVVELIYAVSINYKHTRCFNKKYTLLFSSISPRKSIRFAQKVSRMQLSEFRFQLHENY